MVKNDYFIQKMAGSNPNCNFLEPRYVLVCTGMYWYVLVCTSMYWYVCVCTRMYWWYWYLHEQFGMKMYVLVHIWNREAHYRNRVGYLVYTGLELVRTGTYQVQTGTGNEKEYRAVHTSTY